MITKQIKPLAASFALLIFIAFSHAAVAAEGLSVTLKANSKQMGRDDQIRLVVTTSGKKQGDSETPMLQGIDDFDIVGTGTSSQFSIINGSMSRSKAYTFILSAKPSAKIGDKKIVAMSMVGAERFYSNEVVVKILKNPTVQQHGGNRQRRGLLGMSDLMRQMQNGGKRQYTESDFFVQSTGEPKTIYVGQEFIYKLMFYHAYGIMQGANYFFPKAEQFWVEQLSEQNRIVESQKVVAGTEYMVAEMPLLLYPLTAGQYKLAAGSIKFRTDPFSPDITRQSQELSITVLPLPIGQPDGFYGLVGDFSIKAEADKTALEDGKPVTVTVTISGKGNLHAIKKPEEPKLDEWERFEPESSSDIKRSITGASGKKSYRYILIPKVGGKLSIGSFAVSWLDPISKKYKTAKTEPLQISSTTDGNAKPDEQNIVKSESSSPAIMNEAGASSKNWQNSLLIAALLALAVFAAIAISKAGKGGKTENYKKMRANAYGRAASKIETARGLMNEPDKFHTEVAEAVEQYIKIKFSAPSVEVAVEAILLHSGGAGLAEDIKELMERYNRGRFAPLAPTEQEMVELQKNSIELLNKLERLA